MTDFVARYMGSRMFYGWVIIIAGFGMFMLGGGLLMHAFGTYVKLLEADFGWSRTELSIAFSMQRIESGFLGPIQGWMVDRYGPRAVMLIGMVLFGFGFIAFSFIDSLLWFYVVFVIMATGQSFGSMMSLSVSLVTFFRRRRGLALGIVGTGMATGGLLQPLVVAGLEAWGWRQMAFVSGIIILVVGLPLAALVRHRPQELGLLPDGDEPGRPAGANGASEGGPAVPRRGELHRPRGDAHALVLAALGRPRGRTHDRRRDARALRSARHRAARRLTRHGRADGDADDGDARHRHGRLRLAR